MRDPVAADSNCMTNGYPDPSLLAETVERELEEARQQLRFCDKPWDDYAGWTATVRRLEAELEAITNAR